MPGKTYITILLICCLGFRTAAQDSSAENSASPYFVLTSPDATVESFPLKNTSVKASIQGAVVGVTVTQTYTNDGTEALHARYVFPASTGAAVHAMTMRIGNRLVRADIEKRKEARRKYEKAKAAGKKASLLEHQRPNVFSMDVANVLPGDTVEVELSYTELMTPTENIYEFLFPCVVGPRYAGDMPSGSDDHNSWVRNPYLKPDSRSPHRWEMEVDVTMPFPIQDLECATHQTKVDWKDSHSAVVRLDSFEKDRVDRDFILRYRPADKQIQTGLMVHRGEHENFFLLMVEPPDRVVTESIPPREYLFVVDVSGSMNGFPLRTAQVLMRDLLGNLRELDHFNILLFAGASQVLSEYPLPVTPENIQRAVTWITSQRGGGGTELLPAIQRAMALPQDEPGSRNIVVITDGYISAEREVFEHIKENRNRANVFAFGIGSSVNRYLIEGIAHAGHGEPFVVTEPNEAGAKANRFREYIQFPLLSQIRLVGDGIELYGTDPVADLLADRPLVIAGKWTGGYNGRLRIEGITGHGEFHRAYSTAESEGMGHTEVLKYLWARRRIRELSDYAPVEPTPDAIAEITSLGLTFNLLTRYTSFVAVEEIIQNPGGEGRETTQPLPLPENVSPLAVGGGVRTVPEPDLYLTAVMLIIVTFLWYAFRLFSQSARG